MHNQAPLLEKILEFLLKEIVSSSRELSPAQKYYFKINMEGDFLQKTSSECNKYLHKMNCYYFTLFTSVIAECTTLVHWHVSSDASQIAKTIFIQKITRIYDSPEQLEMSNSLSRDYYVCCQI